MTDAEREAALRSDIARMEHKLRLAQEALTDTSLSDEARKIALMLILLPQRPPTPEERAYGEQLAKDLDQYIPSQQECDEAKEARREGGQEPP